MSIDDSSPDEFVDVTSRKKVERILKSIYNSRTSITAWQTHEGAHVNTLGFLYDYKKNQTQLSFKSIELKEDLGFTQGEEIFFHSPFRTTIFKTKIKKLKKNKLLLDFPMSLKIEQTRQGNRVRLGLKSNQTLIITLYNEEYEKMKIECQILDYSDGGVGLLVPIHLAPFLNYSQIIEIGDSNIGMVRNRYFCVRSMNPLENVLSGAKYLRIGGEFTQKVSKDIAS